MSYLNEYELNNHRANPIFDRCPECGRVDTFQLYINKDKKVKVASHVGKCNPVFGCGYNKELAFKDLGPSYMPNKYLLNSLNNYEQNYLFIYLRKFYGEARAIQAMKRYSVGTSNKSCGASIFWEIDVQGNIHDGTIARVNRETGKQDQEVEHFSRGLGSFRENKSVRLLQDRVSLKLNLPYYNSIGCMFGEHLLKSDLTKNVVIVESEVTAVISSCLFPNSLWLSNKTEEPSKIDLIKLANRKVIYDKTTWGGVYIR